MPLERLSRREGNVPVSDKGEPHPASVRREPEVVPDSEEERYGIQPITFREVIEISSDESDAEEAYRTPIAKRSGSRPYPQRRVIASSEDESEPEVIEISDSDSSVEIIPTLRWTAPKEKSAVVNDADDRSTFPRPPLVDESIITFDEPRSAKTPLRVTTKKKFAANSTHEFTNDPSKGKSLNTRVLINSTAERFNLTTGPLERIKSPAKLGSAGPRPNSQKAKAAAQLQKLYAYAQELFADLNKSVFKGGLPEETKLNWNKRLLTTAGKAKYHRSRDGVQTVEIELAEKILTSEERIRNTLSHEMCHLATWIIDKNIQEHHGKLFKSWAARVMRKRPDIDVTVKHNYEIQYPYEWKCEKCSKIYGRFSKSIKPEECVCGACKEGTLIPQFETRRKPTASKLSGHMASIKSQDSPRSIRSLAPGKAASESSSESEVILALTKSLATTYLA